MLGTIYALRIGHIWRGHVHERVVIQQDAMLLLASSLAKFLQGFEIPIDHFVLEIGRDFERRRVPFKRVRRAGVRTEAVVIGIRVGPIGALTRRRLYVRAAAAMDGS